MVCFFFLLLLLKYSIQVSVYVFWGLFASHFVTLFFVCLLAGTDYYYYWWLMCIHLSSIVQIRLEILRFIVIDKIIINLCKFISIVYVFFFNLFFSFNTCFFFSFYRHHFLCGSVISHISQMCYIAKMFKLRLCAHTYIYFVRFSVYI